MGEAVAAAAVAHSHPGSGSGAPGYIHSRSGSGAKGFSLLSSCSAIYSKFSRQGCKEAALQYLSDMINSKCVGVELRGIAPVSGREKVFSTQCPGCLIFLIKQQFLYYLVTFCSLPISLYSSRIKCLP